MPITWLGSDPSMVENRLVRRLPLRPVGALGPPDNGIYTVDGQAGVLPEDLLGGAFGSEIAQDRRRQNARAPYDRLSAHDGRVADDFDRDRRSLRGCHFSLHHARLWP